MGLPQRWTDRWIAVFLVAGWQREFGAPEDAGVRMCSNCGESTAHWRLERKTKATMFFVPVGTVSTKTYLACTSCDHVREIDVPELLQDHAASPPPAPVSVEMTVSGAVAESAPTPSSPANIEEVGSASVSLHSDGSLALRGARLDRAHVADMSDLSRGDWVLGGAWLKFEFRDRRSWIVVRIEPPEGADEFCDAFQRVSMDYLGLSTTRTANPET